MLYRKFSNTLLKTAFVGTFFYLQFSYGWTTTTAVSTSMRLKVIYDSGSKKYSYDRWVLEEVRVNSLAIW